MWIYWSLIFTSGRCVLDMQTLIDATFLFFPNNFLQDCVLGSTKSPRKDEIVEIKSYSTAHNLFGGIL